MSTENHNQDPASAGLDAKKLLREAIAGGDAEVADAAGAWQPPTIGDLTVRFPELEIVELVGRGGMGAVFRAVQSRLARTVAQRELRLEA